MMCVFKKRVKKGCFFVVFAVAQLEVLARIGASHCPAPHLQSFSNG